MSRIKGRDTKLELMVRSERRVGADAAEPDNLPLRLKGRSDCWIRNTLFGDLRCLAASKL